MKNISKPIFKINSEIEKERILKDPSKYGMTIAQAKYLPTR